jgi:membrane protein involved in colicin uptake
MKEFFKPMKMNLQFFAESESNQASDEQEEVVEEQAGNDAEESSENKETSRKKYSRDDVGKMVAAETKKAVEKAKQEWEKNISKDAEDKESSEKDQNEKSVQEKLAQKEAELAQKEIRLEYREKAQEEGLPLKIIDLIDCSDAEKAESSFKLAKEILGETTSKKKKKQFVSGGNPQSGNPDQLDPFLAGLKGK